MTKLTDVVEATAIRPFHVDVPEADLTELRRRINATKWPERETVTDASQGVQLATMQKLARYWATDYDWRKVRGETERPAAVHHRDRRAGHSFHSRSFEACECVAAHRHARVARLDHRAAEDHRSADESDGTWRECIGRFRPRDPVDAGLRLFREAHHHRLGSAPHRTGLDRADEAPRLHAICGARRRLGYSGHRADGSAGASGSARHPHQHAFHHARRNRKGTPVPAARRRPASRPTRSMRTISSTSSTSTAWPTPRRWATVRRRSTESRIHLSALPPGCSTTTRAVTR